MHQHDNDEKKLKADLTGSPCGISRRTVIKGMLTTGAMTCLGGLGMLATTSCSSGSSNPQHLQLFVNGTIYLDAERKATNLLVEGGVVRAFDVAPEHYSQAEIIDLNQGIVYPGFNDSHAHLLESGFFAFYGVNLSACDETKPDFTGNLADCIAETLRTYLATYPNTQIIIGGGFYPRNYDAWSLEDLAKIDAATGNLPMFLGDKLGHNALINTATIELAQLTPQTPVPLGGKMITQDGKLTGMLREAAMTLPWDVLAARFDKAQIQNATLRILQLWASYGYTSFVEMGGGVGVRFHFPDVLFELEKSGELSLRSNYCYLIQKLSDVDTAAACRRKETDLVRFVGGKIFVDGAYAAGQAWTPWEHQQPGYYGLPEIRIDDSEGREYNLNRIVEKAESLGLNMHYHTQGDRAIDAVLDALDAVRAKTRRLRGMHCLIHLAFITAEQMERIRSFHGHVVTTVQPAFWEEQSSTAYYYGDRAATAYPIKQLIDAGVSVGFSTDFSVSPMIVSPVMAAMGIALTGAGDPLHHPPVSAKDAVSAFSLGSARTTGKNDTGKLYPGYKADMVVYNNDVNFMDPETVKKDNPKLLATYVGGRKVFQAP